MNFTRPVAFWIAVLAAVVVAVVLLREVLLPFVAGTLVLSMPAHRTFVPDADVLGRAALLSGMLSRLQSYANDRVPRFARLRPISAGSETRLHGADRQHRRLRHPVTTSASGQGTPLSTEALTAR